MNMKLEQRIKRLERMIIENEDTKRAHVKNALDTLSSIRQMAESIEKVLSGISVNNKSVELAVMDLNGSIYNLRRALQDLDAINRRNAYAQEYSQRM